MSKRLKVNHLDPASGSDGQVPVISSGKFVLGTPGFDAEAVRDAIGSALVAGTGVTITVNDAGDTITIASTGSGLDAEGVRDTIGAALVAGTGITITVNDAGDTITIANAGVLTTRTISTDSTMTGGGDLSANRTLGVDTTAEAERIRDVIGTALVAGSNVTLTVNDAGDTITIAATGGGSSYVGVKAYRSAAYSLANTAVTAFPWDAEEWDTNAFHDNSTNNTRFTVPSGQEGKYQVSCGIAVSVALTARFLIAVQKNGTTIVHGSVAETPTGSSNSFPAPNLTCEVDLSTAGDYIEIIYYQDMGATKAVATDKCGISMRKIG